MQTILLQMKLYWQQVGEESSESAECGMNYLASNSAWGEGGFRSHLYGSGGRTEEKKASKFWKTAGKKPEGGVKKKK